MMCKTTVDGRDWWRNPYQMMHKQLLMEETIVEYHSRWSTRQLLMDERDEGIHTRWCAKQLLNDEANEGLPIPDDAHKQLSMD